MRTTIEEFVRACNNLADSAYENNGNLTNEECDTVIACIQTLQTTALPHQDDVKPIAATLGTITPSTDSLALEKPHSGRCRGARCRLCGSIA